MEISIEQKLKNLYNLQLIDSKIDKIQSIRGELPMEVSDLEDEVAGLETRLEKLKQEADDNKKGIEAQNQNIKNAIELQKKYEEQQNHVKNNREYLALSKELEMQKLEAMGSEKKIKDLKANNELNKRTVEETKARLETRKTELGHKKNELDAIINENVREEEELRRLRDEAKGRIQDPRLLAAYERVRNSSNMKNGLGVVTIDRDACAGCFSKIPPQRQLDIRQRKKIIVCENCGRIIVDNDLANETNEDLSQKLEAVKA